MTDRELIAKTVFGEINLGEVFQRFECRISAVRVMGSGIARETDSGRMVGVDFHSWELNKDEFVLFAPEMGSLYFPLNTKIKVQDGFFELIDRGTTYRLEFLDVVKFDEILPGAAK